MSPFDDEPAPRPSAVTPVVGLLLIVNVGVFLLQIVLGPHQLIATFGLWPTGTPPVAETPWGEARVPPFQIWQLLTYGFLHGGLLHLAINCFVLWMLGTEVERAWGSRTFLEYFIACLVGAGLIQLFIASQAAADGNIYPTVGASGGVFGILLAFGMMFPNRHLMLLFPPIPIRAKFFVIGLGAFELFAGVTGTDTGIAHFAHLGGMLVGYLMIQYWRGRLPVRPRQRRFFW